MKHCRIQKRISALVLAALLLAGLSVPAFAEGEPPEDTVRIGFYESRGMFAGAGDSEEKSGYCYEYMMQLAVYTGWKYELCYGSFDELYEKLKNGEIDILPYTNYNSLRAEEVLFSDKILAEEEYYIVTDAGGENARAGDPSALNGGRVATIKGADFNQLLLNYIEKNGLQLELVYYPVFDDCWAALRNGEVDAAVYTSLGYSSDGWKSVGTFGQKPTYIAVSKARPELCERLNEAERLARQDSPALLGELYEKYFPDNPMRNSMTAEEQEWIEAHPVLHVGGFTDDAPYIFSCDNAAATASGLTPDLITEIFERLGIEVTADYHCYDSLAGMEAALDAGEIDVIAPFYPDFNIARQHDLVISNTFRVSNMELVFMKGMNYRKAIEKIATPASRLGIYYTRDNFPDSLTVEADSVRDSVAKVLSGEATGAVAQNVALHNVKEQYAELDYVILSEGCGTCFAARPENSALIRILNRGI